MSASVRIVGAGLLVLGLLLILVGSSAVSSVVTTQEQRIVLAGDANGYLGYDTPAVVNASDGTEHRLVTVTNRFHTPLAVDEVDLEPPSGLGVTVVDRPTAGIGERAAIVAEFTCEEPVEEEPLGVTVHVEGDDIAVTVLGDLPSRTIAVSCHPDAS